MGALRDGAREVASTRAPSPEPLYPRLKPGPGLSAERVLANQRARLCGAMIELVGDDGFQRVTVRKLTRLAGVSTKTFYDCFANVEACFVATQVGIARSMLGQTSGTSDGDWGRLRARVRAVFSRLGEEPKAANLILVESLSAGPLARQASRSIRKALERSIGEEFAAAGFPDPTPSVIATGAVSAALRVARADLRGAEAELSTLADPFTDWLLAWAVPRTLRLRGQLAESFGEAAGARADPPYGDERRLLLAAVAKLSLLGGYGSLRIPAICREAGVRRRSFDDNFTGVENCFLAAVEGMVAAVAERAKGEASGADDWERGVVRAVATLGTEFARGSALSRLALIEMLVPGPAGLDLRESIISDWAGWLCRTAPQELCLDALPAEASVAAAWGIAENRAASDRRRRIHTEIPAIALAVLAPALGSTVAERTISSELQLLGGTRES